MNEPTIIERYPRIEDDWDEIYSSTMEVDDALRATYADGNKKYTSWDYLPELSVNQNYWKKMSTKLSEFENSDIKKHFSKNCPNLQADLSRHHKFYSTCAKEYVKADSKCKSQTPEESSTLLKCWRRVVNYFKARPNCPDFSEYKKQKLIEKAQKAAKAAGLQLCELEVKAKNPHKKEEEPKVKKTLCEKKEEPKAVECKASEAPPPPKKTLCERDMSKLTCKKMCLPGCKPPADRDFCIDNADPPCKTIHAPYPSFSEAQRFELPRPKICECNVVSDVRFKREIELSVQNTKKNVDKSFSTYAAVQIPSTKPSLTETSSSNNFVSQRKNFSTSSTTLARDEKCESKKKSYPLEMGAQCGPVPFKPPCDKLKPSPKLPCVPPEAPPPPKLCKYSCPIREKPKPKPRCGLPPRPPEKLIDKCKRYRECCQPPAPPPPPFPCDKDC